MISVRDYDHLDELQTTHPKLLVCYGATWCRPCEDWINFLKGLYQTDYVLAKVDIDRMRTGVRKIPTTKIFIDGHIHRTFEGASVKDEVLSCIIQKEDASTYM